MLVKLHVFLIRLLYCIFCEARNWFQDRSADYYPEVVTLLALETCRKVGMVLQNRKFILQHSIANFLYVYHTAKGATTSVDFFCYLSLMTRVASKGFATAQSSAMQDLVKWSLKDENRAIQDALTQVNKCYRPSKK